MSEAKTYIKTMGRIIRIKSCAACGYKFFGAVGKCCPECGLKIDTDNENIKAS